MKRVEPQVFLIGIQQIGPDMESWLETRGCPNADSDQPYNVDQYIDSNQPSETIIENAARRCYNAFVPGKNPNVTRIREDSDEYFANILKSGHGSVFEHGYSTWAFENVSRVFTHEIVRNRAGLAYSQESLRYVRLGELKFWMPPNVGDESIQRIFTNLVETAEQAQKDLAEGTAIDVLPFEQKKQLTSAFRRIAPIGLATGIVISFNMRALRWVIEQRTSPHAEIEMRTVFNEVGRRAAEEWPNIFQDFKLVENESGPPSWVPDNKKV